MLNLDPVGQEQTPCHHQLLVLGHSLNSQQLFLNCDDVCTLTVLPGRGGLVLHAPRTYRLVATRSTSFETKLMFDIGLYEFKSTLSNVRFLSLGRTIACFWDAGSLAVRFYRQNAYQGHLLILLFLIFITDIYFYHCFMCLYGCGLSTFIKLLSDLI